MGTIGDETRIQELLLADRCMKSSSGTAIKAGYIAFSADGRILSAVKTAGLFYSLKLRMLFFSNY